MRGLLLDGERKSVEPMSKRLPDGNEQAMQQFVGQSPWEWQPVWERLARRMVKELEPDAVCSVRRPTAKSLSVCTKYARKAPPF